MISPVRGLIGLTDFDSYTQLAGTPSLPEVNCWLPGSHAAVLETIKGLLQ